MTTGTVVARAPVLDSAAPAGRVPAAPVLVLGAQPRIAVTVARSLHRHGIPVDVAALSPHEPPLASRAIRNFFRLPSPRTAPDKFAAALVETIRTHGHDMVIPCSDPALTAIAQNYDAVNALARPACPRPEVVERVLDKGLTLQVARRCGVRAPLTHDAADPAALEALRSALRFPLIGKPRTKARANGYKIHYYATFDEVRAALAADPDLGRRAILQEYCVGEGVGVEVLMHAGEPLVMLQHRRLKELPASGGVSVLAEAEAVEPQLAEAAVTLLREIEWDGPAMVEFRYDRARRQAFLMEVNGRYWGSLALAVRAGVDFPYYQWQLAHRQQPAIPASYRVGLQWRWTAGMVRRAFGHRPPVGPDAQGWRHEVRDFLRDLMPPIRDALWSWTDPRPACAELARAIKDVVAIRVRGGRTGRRQPEERSRASR